MGIADQPRLRVTNLPTPLHEAARFRAVLGNHAPRILVKRDDLTGLALGGNKLRKLEFLAGDALRQGATTLITTGAVQSNHTRQTAAIARVAGLKCVLVITAESETPELQGNLLLDYLLGAEVRLLVRPRGHVPGPADADYINEVTEDVRRRGEKPYMIPVGGTSAVGALGYVSAALELEQQLADMGETASWLYFAAGSRGTQAGIVLGAKMYQSSYRPMGIIVSAGEPEKTQRAIRIANEAASLLGTNVRITADDLLTDDRYMGPEYGVPTPEALDAIILLAQSEGIFLDPTYTGKAMAGLIGHIREGRVRQDETVLFLHTGGAPALFAHTSELEDALRRPTLHREHART